MIPYNQYISLDLRANQRRHCRYYYRRQHHKMNAGYRHAASRAQGRPISLWLVWC